MAESSREEQQQHRRLARQSSRERGELVPVGGLPRSVLGQLVSAMQAQLDEMEAMRSALLDAYPCLWAAGGGRRQPRRLDGEDDEEEPRGGYQLCVDVAGFAPEELSVKLAGRTLTVSGLRDQESRADDGCLSREHREVRKEIRLPADADLDAVACTFAPESQSLRIHAPRLAPPPPSPQRDIPIAVPARPVVQAALPSLPAAKADQEPPQGQAKAAAAA